MTASTAPITLPARHRIPAPTWRFHRLVDALAAAAGHVTWTIRDLDAQLGRRHLVVLALAVALPIVALLALIGL